MIFRFTLSHDVLGTLEISEPEGWTDSVLKLERHDQFHSLIEYFEGNYTFYGNNGVDNGGIDFIREVRDTYGPDADLNITIDIAPDNINFETLFIGQLDLSESEEMTDNLLQAPIVRNDFWGKFINRMETPVDIQSLEDLDANTVPYHDGVNLQMHSQRIQVESKFSNKRSVVYEPMLSTQFGQIDWDSSTIDEVNEKFTLISVMNPEVPSWLFGMEYEGSYSFNIQIPGFRSIFNLFIAKHYQYASIYTPNIRRSWINIYPNCRLSL